MHVGIMKLALMMPENCSLKDKRQIVKSAIAQIQNRFKVSIAEVEENDNWTTAVIGISCVSNDTRIVNQIFSNIQNFIEESYLDAELDAAEIEIIDM